ncbi:MAG: serine O-acetyltransferase EpsC [Limnochordia bacterium]
MIRDGLEQNRFSSVFKQLTGIAGSLGYADEPDSRSVPNREGILDLLQDLRSILFPGYFKPSRNGYDVACKLEHLGVIYWRLAGQIHRTLHSSCSHICETQDSACPVMEESCQLSMEFLQRLPAIQAKLIKDVQAAYDGDPAATGMSEIILSYPGIYAVTVHRLAHEFYKMGLVLIARIMSEHAHSCTGIDIHPGAEIGESFFIDHGTGVVIGETCIIGNNVKLYQGVTLGALSFPKDEKGELIRGTRRHPTIEDDVTIYAGATILGGDTVVGRGSVIGGNVWLIESVPPYSKVINRPQIETRLQRSEKKG